MIHPQASRWPRNSPALYGPLPQACTEVTGLLKIPPPLWGSSKCTIVSIQTAGETAKERKMYEVFPETKYDRGQETTVYGVRRAPYQESETAFHDGKFVKVLRWVFSTPHYFSSKVEAEKFAAARSALK